MSRALLVAFLLTLVAGNAPAQNFPTRPLTLHAPFPLAGGPGQHLRAFAQIASNHLGQSITVEFPSGADWARGLATMVTTSRPDGYTLSALSIAAFRVPHIRSVPWDPLKDFTYVIGIAGYTFGVVVKSDSQFKSLKDLIDYAKVNPGRLRYGTFGRGSTPHLAMEELGLKTGARFLHVSVPREELGALIDDRVMAISASTVWGPYVDAGTFRLLATFGERRSKWNAPTATELGFDILSYSPLGIVGPKGMEPKVVKLLHDAFNRSLDDPEYDKLLKRLDIVDWYKSSEDYAEWAVDQFRFQRALIERTIGLGNK